MAINSNPDIHHQIICANMFIRKDGKYLMLRRSPLKKYAPNVVHAVGGKVNIGENPFEAAVREAEEEAGLNVTNVQLEAVLQEMVPVKDEPYNWLIFYFSGDWASGKVKTTDEGELIWLTEPEIKIEDLFPSLRLVIDSILDSSKGAAFVTLSYDDEKHTITEHTINYLSA